MSKENVEVVRRAFDAGNHGGPEAVLRFVDPEIEYISRADFVEPGTFQCSSRSRASPYTPAPTLSDLRNARVR